MLIKDLVESTHTVEFPKAATDAMPNAITSPGMDQYYEYYRFLVAVAGFPSSNIPTDGPIHDGPLMVPYTDVEREHSINVLKKMGKSVKHLVNQPSKESKNRNVVSPVRKFIDLDGDNR